MFISSVSPGNVASAVWAQTARTLTGFGSTTITDVSVTSGAMAALASLSLQPAVGGFTDLALIVQAGAAGSTTLTATGGFGFSVNIASAGTSNQLRNIQNSRGLYYGMLNNDAVNGNSYMIIGRSYNQ